MSTRLVTGAAGFAGRHLIDLLAQTGADVVGWYRPDTRPPSPEATPGVRWQPVDLRDRGAVAQALSAVDTVEVYHLAGAANQGASWANADEALRLNALATQHLLDAIVHHAPAARVLVTTSAAIYAPAAGALDESAPIRPGSPYAVSKLAQEMVARRTHAETGLAVLVVRPFNHTGPGQEPAYFAPSFARQLARIEAGLDPPVLKVGNLDAQRDISDVRDVVRAYERVMALGVPGEVYNVCRGAAFRIGELLDRLLADCRVDVRVETDPSRLRPSDNPVLLGDRSRVSALTGWAPVIPMDRTLRDILDEQRTLVARQA